MAVKLNSAIRGLARSVPFRIGALNPLKQRADHLVAGCSVPLLPQSLPRWKAGRCPPEQPTFRYELAPPGSPPRRSPQPFSHPRSLSDLENTTLTNGVGLILIICEGVLMV